MSRLFLFRLALDFLAVSLLLAAYAYNWLGNAAHEVIGTALFALLVSHNIFNRRWYGTLTKPRREARSRIAKMINLSLLGAMVSLLVTSVIISQTVFGFLPVGTSFTARQAHTLAAYSALLIVALHLGLQWSMIMGLVSSKLGIEDYNKSRAWALRALAFGVAAYGVHSLIALNVAAKLSMQVPMGFEDFQVSTLNILAQHLAVIGLGVCLSHYALKLIAAAGPTRRILPDGALGYRPKPEAVLAPSSDDLWRKKAPDSTTKAESSLCRLSRRRPHPVRRRTAPDEAERKLTGSVPDQSQYSLINELC